MKAARTAALCLALASAPALGKPVVGVASWYGWREHGRPMADGRPFDALGRAAAHRTLPFGTKVWVTNLRNRRSAQVVIEDRGPRPRDRVIDLSLGTARRLRMERAGLALVSLRVVSRPRPRHHRGPH